jgi:DNA-binding NarL/FixJ family response regulator
MSIRILLVEAHAMVREGIRALLNQVPDMGVVAETGNGVEAVRLARELVPDIAVMDLSLPEMNGIEATRRIVDAGIGVKVIMISTESDRRYVVEALRAGADGYLLKHAASSELVRGIHVVQGGDTYLGPGVADVIVKDYLKSIPIETTLTYEALTPREREVLQLLADGATAKDIAFAFGVSLKTVENQRKSLMNKLGIYSTAELTKYAIREGLTSLT